MRTASSEASTHPNLTQYTLPTLLMPSLFAAAASNVLQAAKRAEERKGYTEEQKRQVSEQAQRLKEDKAAREAAWEAARAARG